MPSPVHPYSDYGVALRTLRSARTWLGFTLILCVVAQIVGFALMWWTPQPYEGMKAQWQVKANPVNPNLIPRSIEDQIRALFPVSQPATQSATKPAILPPAFYPGSDENHLLNVREQWATTFTFAIPITQLASLIAAASQTIIMCVTLLVVLVAQAPGVAQLIRGLIWSVLLLFMFLPWQYFARDFPNPGNFPIPGVIYSYAELLQRIGPAMVGESIHPFVVWMIYARFIIWPILGVLALIVTAERFRAGIMIAIGHPLQSMLQPRGTGQPIPTSNPKRA